MKLTFLGSESKDGQSRTLYAAARGTLVVQGWKITDDMVRAQLRGLPDREDVIEIPTVLAKHSPKEV